jgi:diaminohydroxyphosphoribosylaminopyrimidine deaminase / 5-amino-6-(5-phosphoribosylamino)uracil reductase
MTESRADADRAHMARCLAIAEAFRGRTAPNPLVGCVIVGTDGQVLAEGVHRGPGTAHAEADALAKLGGKAVGATLYVNLEPCNHHGRTPPCAPAVRDAGVARVVYGMSDPIPGHGGGAALLKKANIALAPDVLASECAAANRPFLTWALLKRPAITLKAAMTLDGKIASVSGQSKWITGELARENVMMLRDRHDAVLVGIGTVLADDPRLSVRGLVGGRDPIRVIVDSKLRTPTRAKVLAKGPRTIIATTLNAPANRAKALVAAGAEVWRVPAKAGRIDLTKLARELADHGITSLLVEGGGEVHAAMLAAKLVDELVIYVAPKIIGGPAKSWVGGQGLPALADAFRFQWVGAPMQIGPDLVLRAVPLGPRPK